MLAALLRLGTTPIIGHTLRAVCSKLYSRPLRSGGGDHGSHPGRSRLDILHRGSTVVTY